MRDRDVLGTLGRRGLFFLQISLVMGYGYPHHHATRVLQLQAPSRTIPQGADLVPPLPCLVTAAGLSRCERELDVVASTCHGIRTMEGYVRRRGHGAAGQRKRQPLRLTVVNYSSIADPLFLQSQ